MPMSLSGCSIRNSFGTLSLNFAWLDFAWSSASCQFGVPPSRVFPGEVGVRFYSRIEIGPVGPLEPDWELFTITKNKLRIYVRN